MKPQLMNDFSSLSEEISHTCSEFEHQITLEIDNANDINENNNMNNDNGECAMVLQRGYKITKYLCETLQGDITLANDIRNNNKTVVIKRTSKLLHSKKVTIVNGIEYSISENVIREANILKILNKNKHPPSLIGFVDFFQTEKCYYLVMEDGGTSFFSFVKRCHSLIENGLLSISHWRKQCKCMFAQMCRFQAWMHGKGFCNLDISLENMLISHDCYYDYETQQLHNCHIKFIDFGLSEFFPEHNFKCTKFAGKKDYKSPEIWAEQAFDARQADIWALGIALFAMLCGRFPYQMTEDADGEVYYDRYFALMEQQNWMGLVQELGVVRYFSAQSLDLIKGLLDVRTCSRFGTMREIYNHGWIAKYFQTKSSRNNATNDQSNK